MEARMPKKREARPPRIFAALIALLGLFMLIGGIWLLSLGGSPYYAAAGAAIFVSAAFLWYGNQTGSAIFQLTTIATVLWAIWESGLDPWAVAPRVSLLVLLTAYLYMPWVRRGLYTDDDDDFEGNGSIKKAAAVVAVAVIGFGAMFGAQMTEAEEGAHHGDRGHGTQAGDWRNIGGGLNGARYSTLNQINEDNIGELREVWRYQTGDGPRDGDAGSFAFDATPIEIGDTLYFCTPHRSVIALTAETGAERWRFDPEASVAVSPASCRGVAYRAGGGNAVCASKIFSVISDARLVALDAETGAVCEGFGDHGFVSLTDGNGSDEADAFYLTSPPAVVGDRVIVGGGAGPDHGSDAASGVLRSFNAGTGAQEWSWDIGRTRNAGSTRGTPATIAPITADPELGLIYVATGSPPLITDGTRLRNFDERYANSIVALEANSGRVRWSFQTTHRDVWAYGLDVQPVLVDLLTPTGMRRAVVQATKQGEVFVLDRADGQPISRVTEEPAPRGGGLPLSETQPRSKISFVPEPLSEEDMWGFTPLDQLVCRIRFRAARYEGLFTPPGTRPSITFPAPSGGIGEGGIAIDQRSKLIVANTNLIASYDQIVRQEDGTYEKTSEPFFGPLGVPCNQPPWSIAQLYDLKTDNRVWSRAENHLTNGGALITEGALAFIGGAADGSLRAQHLYLGTDLWSTTLPAGVQTSPMTYLTASGRQFLVIAAGGGEASGAETGDYLVAYALPEG
jgi:quinoprotein glucose dehydrogenase